MCAVGGPSGISTSGCRVCSGEESELANGAGAEGTVLLQNGTGLNSPLGEENQGHAPNQSPQSVPDARIGRAGLQCQDVPTCVPCPQCGRACVGSHCALRKEFCPIEVGPPGGGVSLMTQAAAAGLIRPIPRRLQLDLTARGPNGRSVGHRITGQKQG